MTVYLVSTGEYSDWSICGIFSTRALAEEYMKQAGAIDDSMYVSKNFNDIEEWVVDAEREAKVRMVHRVGVRIIDGAVLEGPSKMVDFTKPISESYVAEDVPIYHGHAIARASSTRSAAHAMKLAVEARQEYRAKKAAGR